MHSSNIAKAQCLPGNRCIRRDTMNAQRSSRAKALSRRSTSVVRDSQELTNVLLKEIEGSERGNKEEVGKRQRIIGAIEGLEAVGKDQHTTGPDIDASWKLLWTTEKETLFILKYASFFRTEASDVYQVINTAASYLQNVIVFQNGASFVVDSSLEKSGDRRLLFKFTGAQLNLQSRRWRLPPFGKGWFDTTFLSQDIRIARDIRGDILVVKRDGPPRKF